MEFDNINWDDWDEIEIDGNFIRIIYISDIKIGDTVKIVFGNKEVKTGVVESYRVTHDRDGERLRFDIFGNSIYIDGKGYPFELYKFYKYVEL